MDFQITIPVYFLAFGLDLCAVLITVKAEKPMSYKQEEMK